MSVEATGSIAYLGAARFQGYWNASTNVATGSGLAGAASGPFTVLLINSGYNDGTNLTASAGDYWQVTGSGTTTINGETNWNVNDWAIYSGSASGSYESGKWLKLNFEDTIASIVIGDLSSSSFHMGLEHDKHIIFASGSVHHGTESFTYDYNTSNLFLSGAMFVSGTGVDITAPQGASAILTLRADQGDDATDTTTITVANGGNTTIATGADLTLDPGGGDVVVDGHLSPGSDSADSLGRPGVAWSALYVDDIDLNGQGSISMGGTGRIDLDADDDTSIRASAEDTLKIEVGGVDLLTMISASAGPSTQLTGALFVSGSGLTLTAPQGGSAILTLKADQGDDVADTATLVVANSGATTLSAASLSMFTNAFNIGTDTDNDVVVTFKGNSSDGVITWMEDEDHFQFADEILIEDDKKIYFGNLPDASIEYDENGADSLTISGSVGGGLVLSGSKLVLGSQMVPDTALAVAADSIPFFDADGTLKRDTIVDLAAGMAGAGLGASSGQLTVDLSEVIASDAANAVLTSDGDGTATGEANLTFDGSSLFVTGNIRVADDKKIYFGGIEDGYIEYDEDGADSLTISGSVGGGLVLSGSKLVLGSKMVSDTAIAVAADSIPFFDADGTLKRDTIVDLATAMAGTGLTAASGQLVLHFAEIGGVTMASTDSVMILDNGSATKRVSVTNLAAYQVGTNGGLAQTAGVMNISSSAVAAATVAVASDTVMFFDMPSGVVKQESIADLVSGIASTGLDASSGQLTVDVSDFMANGVNNRLVTATGADAMNAEANLTFDGTSLFVTGNVRLQDDKNIYFGGPGEDALIRYQETGDNFLYISGSSAGTAISGTTVTISATNTHLKTGAGAAYAVITDGGLVPQTAGAFDLGDGSSSGKLGDVYIHDDKKIIFGLHADASIHYRETGDDLLSVSGSSGGMVLSGSYIYVGGLTDAGTTQTILYGKVGVNDPAPKTAFNVYHNYQATTFENQLTDGQGGGEKLIYSPGANDTLTAGQIYFLHTDGTWDATDADAVATGATQLLGVGLGGGSQAMGVLTKGFIKIPSTEILNLPGSGACDGLPLFVSTTAGHFDFTAPSGNNDFVRIVGYAIDDDSNDVLVYFDPDSTHVVVSA